MLSSLPSYKRQQLLLEFAVIKSKCPEGIYLAPSPTDPNIWSGVFFVRGGPYNGTVLRFEIAFPSSYPDHGPSLSFFTEVFHPLLVPLTTYTFATGALDPHTTVSSSEAERLPPGSFNLRECIPDWHGDSSDSKRTLFAGTRDDSPQIAIDHQVQTTNSGDVLEPVEMDESQKLLMLLGYVKRAFEDPEFLDALPFRSAVNANAWHAWRAHRGLPKMGSRSISPASVESGRTPLSPGKMPGDWNWDGVWESRVRNGMEESISDAALFSSKTNRSANSGPSNIRFAKNEDDKTREIQDAMLQVLGIVSDAT